MSPRFADEGLDWIVPSWRAPSGVRAFSTTRNGGVSRGACASLNLGFRAGGDDAEAIAENRRRVARFLPSPPVWLDQTHGADVAIVDGATAAQMRIDPPVADAAVTRERDVVLAVLTADCLPVLIAARDGSTIGIAHAGWRGLARGVLENAIAAMRASAGLMAWLGPAIGPQSFEVGDDVRAAFLDNDPGAAVSFRPMREGKWLADLYALARRRLERAGVTGISGGDSCTYLDPARFFSYRRDRETGRMATLAWLSSK